MKPTLCEKLSIPLNQLAGHGSACQLCQSLPLVALVGANCNLLDLVYGHLRRSSQTLDDYLRADTLLNVILDLLQDLTCQDDDGRSTIANFGVLRSGNIDEDSGCGVDNVQELLKSVSLLAKPHAVLAANLHDGCAIVGNRLPSILIHHQQVTAIGTQSGLYRGLNSQTRINIGDNLSLALGSVGP